MKIATVLAALVAPSTAAAFGNASIALPPTPCAMHQYYCGSTLRSEFGYETLRLVDVYVSSAPSRVAAASPDLAQSLFYCGAHGSVEYTRQCATGCEPSAATNKGDACSTAAEETTAIRRALAAQATTSDIWAGTNSYFLHAFQDADRAQVLDAMKAAGLKVVRIFISNVDANNKGTGCAAVPDVEVGTPGAWNDAVLSRVDKLMLEVQQRGMKLIITMHDRWMLGHWGSDAYVAKYKLSGDDIFGFYADSNAAADMDRRFARILTHKNPHFGNRAWGDLDEAVLSFGIENESQGAVSKPNFKWVCDRAKAARQYITKKTILLSSGGGRELATSLHADLVGCDALDILGVHFYGASAYDIRRTLYDAVLANKKRVYVEEFGAVGAGKADDIRSQIKTIKDAGVPWMVWQVSKPGKSSGDYEVWTDEPTWQVLQNEAASPSKQAQKWPELGFSGDVAMPSKPDGLGVRRDWEFCATSTECANGCCSTEYSDDGKLKCTPGGSKAQCVSGGAGVGLGDWEFCTSNSMCRNGCCSNEYSNDGKLKCTPGGTLSRCSVSNGLKNDWNLCATSSECENGCCSKQYSNDGSLKCTPDGARDQCVGTGVAGIKTDWDFCTTSSECANGCCSSEYSDDGKLKCTPGGSKAKCVGATSVNGEKLDWEPCTSGSECVNGCCSKEYSNDGKLKCTPGGTRSKCTLKGDWELCQSSPECTNGCCSKQYSGDGKFKCTPGGSKDQCINAFSSGGSLVGDWGFCTRSAECVNGCCSTEYSGDGKLKCTPGGTKTKCQGFGPDPSTPRGDWDFCDTNLDCANGCCSSEYSGDGKLKCTPGGTKSKCTGTVVSAGGDWEPCSSSELCASRCCSRQYSSDNQLKCTPGGDASQCVGSTSGPIQVALPDASGQTYELKSWYSQETYRIGTTAPGELFAQRLWDHLTDDFYAPIDINSWSFSYYTNQKEARSPSCVATIGGHYSRWDEDPVHVDGWGFRDMYVMGLIRALEEHTRLSGSQLYYTDMDCSFNPRTEQDECRFVGNRVRIYQVPQKIKLRIRSNKSFQHTEFTLDVKCSGDESTRSDACPAIGAAMAFMMAIPHPITGIIGNLVSGTCALAGAIVSK